MGGKVSLGWDVGDFLELEGTFERDGIHGAAADEEGVFVFRVVGGDFGDAFVLLDDLGDECGDALDFTGEAQAVLAGITAAAAELEGHHEQHGHLAGEGLGGGY